ncbi:MAG: hypothetical protein MUP82_08315 [Candidatus Marinimicrobia bacterium]|nr:hypothetical protein [Candidatus Neomarinimicrobiota bacterium]
MLEAKNKNQFSEPIKRINEKLKGLEWSGIYLFPSLIEGVALAIVMIIFIILWPYGILPIIVSFLWELIEENIREINGKPFSEAMPYTIAIGIYFIVSIPFIIICLPIYIIGFIGKKITGEVKQ